MDNCTLCAKDFDSKNNTLKIFLGDERIAVCPRCELAILMMMDHMKEKQTGVKGLNSAIIGRP